MGSVTCAVDVPANITTKEALKKWWLEYIERTEDLYGSAYDNGYLTAREGIVFIEKRCTRDEAMAYVDEFGVKRGSVFAFWMTKQNVDFSTMRSDPKIVKAQEEANRQLMATKHAIRDITTAERKYKKVKCPHCGSNIATEYPSPDGLTLLYMRQRICPVCTVGSLLSKGDTKKIERAEATLAKANARLKAAQDACMAKLVKAAPSFEAWTVIGIAAT